MPILDILRGFALCGIMFANIFILSGYRNLSGTLQNQFASYPIDQWILVFHEIFLRFKFYTLFAFLFGVGFSILLAKAHTQPHFVYRYLKRLTLLFIIGWLHALLFSPHDILRIYAVAGVFLLLFKDLSDRNLLIAAGVILFMPVIMGLFEQANFYFHPNHYVTYSHGKALSAFREGPWMKFISSNYDRTLVHLANSLTSKRFLKILGLFLLGLYVGRKQILYHLDYYLPMIKRLLPFAWILSIAANVMYAELKVGMHPALKELAYIISVYPMSFTYVITIIYLCRKQNMGKIACALAAVGRLSLTNYLAESILAACFMLWFGLRLATQLHISEYYLVALAILIIIFVFSHYWTKYFQTGPIEYLIRR